MANEVFEVILTGRIGGNFCQTVLHFKHTTGASGGPYALAKEIGNDMNTTGKLVEAYCGMLPEQYVMTSLRVRQIGPSGGPTYYIIGGTLYLAQGQREGEISLASNAPLIIWIPTVLPAKTGRIFLPGVSEDDITNGDLSAGLIAAMDAFGGQMNTEQVTSGSVGYQGCVHRRADNSGDLIDQYHLSPIVGNQRRRLKPV